VLLLHEAAQNFHQCSELHQSSHQVPPLIIGAFSPKLMLVITKASILAPVAVRQHIYLRVICIFCNESHHRHPHQYPLISYPSPGAKVLKIRPSFFIRLFNSRVALEKPIISTCTQSNCLTYALRSIYRRLYTLDQSNFYSLLPNFYL
jgi:hypothetical protein